MENFVKISSIITLLFTIGVIGWLIFERKKYTKKEFLSGLGGLFLIILFLIPHILSGSYKISLIESGDLLLAFILIFQAVKRQMPPEKAKETERQIGILKRFWRVEFILLVILILIFLFIYLESLRI